MSLIWYLDLNKMELLKDIMKMEILDIKNNGVFGENYIQRNSRASV